MDNNNNTVTEKLIRFLDGELSESENKALQTELEHNASMQNEMENLLLAKSAIKNFGHAKKVNGIHHAMMKEMSTDQRNKKPVVRNLAKMIMRIAAGVILLVGLFGLYQYLTVSSGSLYNDQYAAYQTATMRGTTTESNLEKAYIENNPDTLIALYNRTANATANEQFLAAQSYIIKGDYNNSIKLFSSIIEKNSAAHTGALNDEAEYYLALSYLKHDETDKALPLFKKIHDDKDHLYHNKISSWYLAKLKLLNWKK